MRLLSGIVIVFSLVIVACIEHGYPDDTHYDWAEYCSADLETPMQRVRGPFVVGSVPTYDDPGDPLVHPTGNFNKDPLQSPTALTPDWANHVQEELCNLVVALGGTLDDALDDQLATLMEQGTFAPVLKGLPNQAGITYTRQDGAFVRFGSRVFVSIDIQFSNTDNGQNTEVAAVQLPFAADVAVPPGENAGTLHAGSSFPTQGSGFVIASLSTSIADPGDDALIVNTKAANWASATSTVKVGDDESIRIIGTISYWTTGTYLY